MNEKLKKRTLILPAAVLLGIFVILAFFLRFYVMPSNLFFGPEQGRDFLVIRDIVQNHKMTLIGSKTDIEGVFHGPLFYYVAAIPFLISRGDPLVVSAFFIAIQSLSLIALYFLGKEMFGKTVGILAAVLFSFSWGAIVYARWLSNPPLSMPLGILFALFTWRFLQGNKKYLLLVAITFGMLGQAEFINFLFYGGFILLLIIIYRQRLLSTPKLILLSSVAIALISSVMNFLLFDLRHQWLITNSLLALAGGKSGFYLSYPQAAMKALETFFVIWSYFVYPNSFVIAFILLVLSLVIFIRKYKKTDKGVLLYLWLFTPLLVLIGLRHDSLEHLFLMSAGAYIVLIAYFISYLIGRNYVLGYLILSFLLLSQVLFWKSSILTNRHVTFQAAQPDLYYRDQQFVIKRIFAESNGKPFDIQSYTIPYWSQQAWEYLFWHTATEDHKKTPVQGANMLFVIIQKDTSSPLYQKEWLEKTVSRWGKTTSSFSYGILEVRHLMVR